MGAGGHRKRISEGARKMTGTAAKKLRMDHQVTYPSFFLIGAGKSGTTSLYEYLKQHPQLFLPGKDLAFFALEGMTKTLGYDADDPDGYHHYPGAITNWNDYLKAFSQSGAGQIAGEACTMYLYKPGVIRRMQHYLPRPPKCIAILRHPARRLFSRYVHLMRENRVPDTPFSQLWDQSSIWWKKDDLVPEGFYYRHLLPFYEAFSSEQMLVLRYEEFVKYPRRVFQQIFTFLEVDPGFEPNMELSFNPGGKVRHRWLQGLLYGNQGLGHWVNQKMPNARQRLKSSRAFMKILYRARSLNLEKQHLPEALSSKIIDQIYREDILQLADLTGQDISSWLDQVDEQTQRTS